MSDTLAEYANALSLNGTTPLSSKVGYYPDRVEAWKKGQKVVPITIDVAMTRRCQAACSWCFAQTQASDGPGDEIPRDRFMAFLEDAAALGVRGVSYISDGESTLASYYVEAVKYAKQLGLAVGIGSNGIKLTKDVLEEILPALSYARFNFSAGTPKRYAEVMGLRQHFFHVVVQNIRDGMEIIRRDGLKCSLNMQMVLHPRDGDQIIPFAELVCSTKPVYGIIKHCSDDNTGVIGVDYDQYRELEDALRQAEEMGRRVGVRIAVKWDKIKTGRARQYDRCFGANFIMQISGSGTVAPCGPKFNSRFQALHLGSIVTERFRDIFNSPRWDEVMSYLGSEHFDPRCRCSELCLQHESNNWLYEYANGRVSLPTTPPPPDIEFI